MRYPLKHVNAHYQAIMAWQGTAQRNPCVSYQETRHENKTDTTIDKAGHDETREDCRKDKTKWNRTFISQSCMTPVGSLSLTFIISSIIFLTRCMTPVGSLSLTFIISSIIWQDTTRDKARQDTTQQDTKIKASSGDVYPLIDPFISIMLIT
jgi:hypothetical protein